MFTNSFAGPLQDGDFPNQLDPLRRPCTRRPWLIQWNWDLNALRDGRDDRDQPCHDLDLASGKRLHNELERSTIFTGTDYFYGHVQWLWWIARGTFTCVVSSGVVYSSAYPIMSSGQIPGVLSPNGTQNHQNRTSCPSTRPTKTHDSFLSCSPKDPITMQRIAMNQGTLQICKLYVWALHMRVLYMYVRDVKAYNVGIAMS